MTTAVREYMRQSVAEGGSALLSFTLEDEAGAPVTLAALLSLKWWLFDEAAGAGGAKVRTTINGRADVDIKNTNGGTVHATSGACTLAISPADNAIVDPTASAETHVAFIKGIYNGGAGVVEKEIAFRCINLSLPTP
jgi:hypothetical protein